MKVKNINGTADNQSCKCGSWLDHWKKYSGESLPTFCAETTCMNKPTVGAHVQKAGGDTWYIVPFCATHNAMKGKELDVLDSTAFAAANVSTTCGK